MNYNKEGKSKAISRVGRKQSSYDIRLNNTRLLLKKWLYFENFTEDRLNGAEGKSELLKGLEILEAKDQNLYQILESYYITNSKLGGGLYETQLPLLSKVAKLNSISEKEFSTLLIRATQRLKTIMEKEGNKQHANIK
ncbi:hypothetical protein [Desemzia sp. FAM 23991]|uniref:hypothetical protein n=1 Tax=Desemzia sp. FAM 23991 TaxID=3259521 RepID=UPI003889A8E7